MPTLSIDNVQVEVPDGATVLDAARKLGIDVPTLCYLEGFEPSTSCQVCVVKRADTGQVVPSCAMPAVDGMRIESETDEVHRLRRTALELLLSDHLGDCLAPCHFNCPAHMDIPLMLRQIHDANMHDAIRTIKRDIALPAVLGRICTKPCELGCRRDVADGPVAVCQLKRYVADRDLDSPQPFRPTCQDESGKRVAIVGAGCAGLSAAYYLRQRGHAVTLFESQKEPGGRMRTEFAAEQLPSDVLDREVQQIIALGIELRTETPVGQTVTLDQLRQQFDAVLVAGGTAIHEPARDWGLPTGKRGVEVDRHTYRVEQSGVFAVGGAIRRNSLPIRSVADGKEAAAAIDQFLAGAEVVGQPAEFSVRLGRAQPEEMPAFLSLAADAPRREPEPAGEYTPGDAAEQSERCLQCGCRAHGNCTLERYARMYHADPKRFAGPRRSYEVNTQHAGVLFEPGKCIKCELCIQVAARAKEPLGLTFIGRGFDVRLGVPFDRSLDEALSKVAAECIAVCPTAALSRADAAASTCAK